MHTGPASVLSRLFSINIFPVPHPVEHHCLLHDIIPYPVWPNLQAPLANTLAFKLFDVRRRAKWVGCKALQSFEDIFLSDGR